MFYFKKKKTVSTTLDSLSCTKCYLVIFSWGKKATDLGCVIYISGFGLLIFVKSYFKGRGLKIIVKKINTHIIGKKFW